MVVLLSGRGSSVDLRPLQYQFPAMLGEQFDDNWLVIGGEIATALAPDHLPIRLCSPMKPLRSRHGCAVADRTVLPVARDTDGLLVPDLSFL